ncbi:MAG: protein-glutamate O-methyltransferase CheR [Planctomycetes bacterium]|nr:protein-glutamate O-methyltransferase CheR [Planctomycetota bacterium]
MNTLDYAPMSTSEFARVQRLVRRYTGIEITAQKREMLHARLAKRVRALGLGGFGPYIRALEDGHEVELREFISAITTNLTHFFREPHHFEMLEQEILPTILERADRASPIRIWSAGCSTGMEPYSIAMVAREQVPQLEHRRIQIHACDIDQRVLEIARRGVYSQDSIADVAPERLRRWFRKGVGANSGWVRVTDDLRASVRYFEMNLSHEWSVHRPFDVIFCRNVLIYFEPRMQVRIVDRFADALPIGGTLFLGHSESLYRKTTRFECLSRTAFRRIA